MASWDDISNSFKATLYERSKAPFYGTFLITWILYNWKIWYLLFFTSDIPTSEKFELISTKYIEYWSIWGIPLGWGNLYNPILVSALVFVIGILINMGFLFVKYYFSNITRSKIEGKNLLDEKTNAEIWTKIYSKEIEIENKIRDKNLELETLKKNFSDFKDKIPVPLDEIPSLIKAKDDLLIVKSELTISNHKISEIRNIVRNTVFNPVRKINFLNVIDVFNAGWRDEPTSKKWLTSIKIEDEPIYSKALSLTSSLDYHIDFIIKDDLPRRANFVKFLIRGTGDFQFYIRLKCLDNPNDYWLRIHDGNIEPRENENWVGREFYIFDLPIELDGKWKEYFINVDEIFRKTFANKGLRLHSVDGIRLRGSLQLAEVSFYNLPENYGSMNVTINK